jgi:hypothetical protein
MHKASFLWFIYIHLELLFQIMEGDMVTVGSDDTPWVTAKPTSVKKGQRK